MCERQADVAAPAPVPFYFGPVERRLFGWYHAPRAGVERHIGVILCRPLNYEAICTHALYRYFAEQLAHAGYPALRFDYDGTGDSFGGDEEPCRVQAWQESTRCAIETLRETSVTDNVVLFGMRLGATIATTVAAERDDISGLILWGACPTGSSYLRELRALSAVHRLLEAPQEQDPPPAYEEAAGFVITVETATDLRKMDATALTRRPTAHALLIDRDDLPSDKRLGKSLSALGTTVTLATWPGYAALMRDAQDTQIPQTTIAEIIGWLDRETVTAMHDSPCPTKHCLTLTKHLQADRYAEEPMLRNDSFGILTHPHTRVPRSQTVVVLLSVGANPHLGPNRMYVPLARELASLGFSVFRLDVPGIGDSARGSETGRERIYSASALDDVRIALDDLERRLGAENFVVIGLCSGAYIAYQIASGDARVQAQVLLNIQTFEWHAGDSLDVRLTQSYKPTITYFSSLQNGGILKRLLLGQVDVKGILGALCRRFTAKATLEAKNIASLVRHGRLYETSVCHTLRKIAERGTNTLFVFAAEDYGVEVIASHIGAKGYRIRPPHRPTIEIIPHADHTFTQKASRDQMLSCVVEYLCTLFPHQRL